MELEIDIKDCGGSPETLELQKDVTNVLPTKFVREQDQNCVCRPYRSGDIEFQNRNMTY